MKLRKLTALGMAAVMTMSLAACGSSNSTKHRSTSSNNRHSNRCSSFYNSRSSS